MIRIGEAAPGFQTAALVDGTLCYIDSARFRDSWVMLCFVPHLGLIETSFLNRQAESRHFVREDCTLLAVAPEGDVFLQPWMRRIGNLRAILLIDPLRRLHRAYAVPRAKTPARCRSFVIDPDGLLRFQVLHDLNGRGISILSEILDASRAQPARAACRLKEAVMKILSCLRCQHRSLVSTGAFWSCGTCGYAITQAALFTESGQVGKRQTPASTFGERNR